MPNASRPSRNGDRRMDGLCLRTIVAFLVLPGTVGVLFPLLLIQPTRRVREFAAGGWPVVAIAVALLLWCVREFYSAGGGTLAPWSPPKHLVATGPYQFSRNPMYVAVSMLVCGWAVGFRSAALAVYAAAVMIAFQLRFQLRVVFGEEPSLAHRFGPEWARYTSRVRRWL
jgi:protein-S-isoprenylcysteine O-methyltransferase Ste14